MELKKGKRVKIVRNLGPEADKARDAYYHGGDLAHTPIGSKGTIISGDRKDLFRVALDNGYTWSVHPNEIAPISPIDAEGLAGLQKHPFFEMGSQNPIFLINDFIYTLGDEEGDKDFVKTKNLFAGKKRELIEVGPASSLDELALQRLDSDLEKIQTEYLEEVKEQIFTEQEEHIGGNTDIAKAIYLSVFPYLRDESYKDKLGEMLGAKQKKAEKKRSGKAEIERSILEKIVSAKLEKVSGLVKEIESEEDEPPAKKRNKFDAKVIEILGYQEAAKFKPESMIGESTGGRNIALINGQVYNLSPVEEDKKAEVMLGRKRYALAQSGDQASLENKYLFQLSKKARIDALNKKMSRKEIEAGVAEQFAGLEKVLGRTEYSEGDFGFATKNDRYYVFVKMPAFAIKSQYDDNYYLFEETRVGINVTLRNGQLSFGSEAYMIDNNNHPFLHNRRGSFQLLCLGHNSLTDEGKDNGEIIANRLRQISKVLMFGYQASDYASDYQLTSSNPHYSSNRKTLAQIEKLEVPIIQGGRGR